MFICTINGLKPFGVAKSYELRMTFIAVWHVASSNIHLYRYFISKRYNMFLLTWYQLLEDIEDIYFFEVNTKFILPNILKISVISRVRSTSEMADIFNTRDEIFLVFTEKSKFPLRENLTFFPSHFSLILLGSARLVGTFLILGINAVCT